MKKLIILALGLLPSICFGGEITKENIIGDWDFLGSSMELTKDHSSLLTFGSSVLRYSSDGSYEYIREGKEPLRGTWSFDGKTLTIKRIDGSFSNKVHSFQDGVLITYEPDFEPKNYRYSKKK